MKQDRSLSIYFVTTPVKTFAGQSLYAKCFTQIILYSNNLLEKRLIFKINKKSFRSWFHFGTTALPILKGKIQFDFNGISKFKRLLWD